MLIVTGAIFALMRDSMTTSHATLEMSDGQESARTGQEYITRDLLNTGDGLNSLNNIRVPQDFVTNYLTLNPVTDPSTPGIINLGLVTSDNDVPANTVVLGTTPAVSVRATPLLTDRISILQMERPEIFTPITLAAGAINPTTGLAQVSPADIDRFSVGEIYFITSAAGGIFATITDRQGVGTPTPFLVFGPGDAFGLNSLGAGGQLDVITAGATLPTSICRMKIIHYYVNSNGLLMRRVFGVKGAGFRESPVAEHVVHHLGFGGIVRARSRAVRIHEVDLVRGDARACDGRAHGHDAACGFRVRARDVICVAREAVTADLRLRARPTTNRVRLGFEHQHPGALPENEPLAIQIEGLTSILRHGREAHEAAVLQLLNDLGGAADDHVGPPGTNQVGREADGVVARCASGRQGEHHALCPDGTRHVNGKQRGAVLWQQRALHGLGAAMNPAVVEVGDDAGLAHRRSEHHGGAPALEVIRAHVRVGDGHAGCGEGHRRAAAGASELRLGQVVLGSELFDLTGVLASESARVERFYERYAASSGLQ